MEWIRSREALPARQMEVFAVREGIHGDKVEIFTFLPDAIQWCWQDRNNKKYRLRSIIWWMPLPKMPYDYWNSTY
jgi:hypothetical protein